MVLAADNLTGAVPLVAQALHDLTPEPIQDLVRRCAAAGAKILDLNPGYLSRRFEDRMVGWPKRECEVIPVAGMTRKDIMRLTNCPYMTAVTAEKRGYYIIDYLKKSVHPKRGYVDGPVDLGRERETIPIPKDINTIEGVTVHFNCNQKVAKASLARGYFIVDYNKRIVCPSLSEFDAEAAYRMVRFIYRRKFHDGLPRYIEAQDLIQEGVLRLLELSGHPQ